MKTHLALALLAGSALAAPEAPERHVVARQTLTPEPVRGTFLGEPLGEFRYLPEAGSEGASVLEVAAPGTRVRKGAVLLRLDPARLDERIREAQTAEGAAAEAARISAEELKAQRLTDEAALASARSESSIAEQELKGFLEIQAPLQRREAALATLGLGHSLSDQKEELAQLEAMYGASELAKETKEIVLERARRDLERRKEHLEIQKRREAEQLSRDQARQEAQLTAARDRKLAALEAARISTAAGTARKALQAQASETDLRKARERLAALRRDRERMTVTAPAEGIVLHGPFLRGKSPLGAPRLSAGDRAEANVPLLSLMATEATIAACARVPEPRLPDFAEGRRVTLVPTSDPRRTLKGRVREVSALPPSASDDGREPFYRVVVALEGPSLPPGCEAEVRPEPAAVVAVPARALKREGGRTRCTVEGRGGKAEPREVVAGCADGDLIEVRAGLEPGETVLIGAEAK